MELFYISTRVKKSKIFRMSLLKITNDNQLIIHYIRHYVYGDHCSILTLVAFLYNTFQVAWSEKKIAFERNHINLRCRSSTRHMRSKSRRFLFIYCIKNVKESKVIGRVCKVPFFCFGYITLQIQYANINFNKLVSISPHFYL